MIDRKIKEYHTECYEPFEELSRLFVFAHRILEKNPIMTALELTNYSGKTYMKCIMNQSCLCFPAISVYTLVTQLVTVYTLVTQLVTVYTLVTQLLFIR